MYIDILPANDVIGHLSTVKTILGLLKLGALMVLSRPGRCEESATQNGIVVVDNRRYSDAYITFYRRKA